MDFPLRKPSSALGLAAGLGAVAAVTAGFTKLLPVNASTAGFFYLLVVLGVATTSGFRVAAAVSVAAMLCFNYFFFPPVGTFTIADPANWAALFTFLLTALVASHLSDRAQEQAAEARRRQLETEQLYSLSRAILLTEPSRPIGNQAAQSIAQIFDSPAVLLLDDKSNQCFRGGAQDLEGMEERLKNVVRQATHYRDESRDLDIWPIALGGDPIGALATVSIRLPDSAMHSMLNLVAIALERVRTQDTANRAEAARQSEEFKSTLLDAIAHEFKTPLTSIKAAATGLRTLGHSLSPNQKELAAIIDEEADRLSHLVTEAVQMAEIDAGKVTLHRVPIPVADLLAAARETFDGRGAERLRLGAAVGGNVFVDRELLILAVRQVFDNALKYSPPDSPVVCTAALTSGRMLLRIVDQGPGVPEQDSDRIFEKFYRRASVRELVPGSGLGLSIAREIARVHDGDLWVEPAEAGGAAFCFSLPLAPGDAA